MAKVGANRFKTDTKGRIYIVVISGDTLSHIAEGYRLAYDTATTYQDLVAINQIADANKICVGQTIYLTTASSGSTSSPPATVTSTRSVTITQFGLLADGVTNELYATWTWGKETDTQEYDIEWKWYRAGVWKYSDSTEIRKYSTFTIPDDGITSKIQFRVRPVPKVDKQNDKEVARFDTNLWTDWEECTYYVVNRPDAPTAPNVKLNLLTLTATVTNVDVSKVSLVEFKLVKDGNESTATIAKATLDDTGEASYTFVVLPGAKYKVCCRSKSNTSEEYSEWSDYSGSAETQPDKVTLKDPVAKSTTSISLEWSKSATATGYTIEYTNDADGFYEGAQTTTADTESLTYTVNGLTTGTTYHFRVKAKNGTEESEWSESKTCTIGTIPTAPTTWSSTTTAIAGDGETVSLYWVHNATDGSAQKSAEVTLTFEGIDNISLIKNDVRVELGKIEKTTVSGNTVTYEITASTAETDVYKTHSLIIDTKNYESGAKITWKVVTISATNKASEASMDRVVNIYDRPTVYLTVTDSSGNGVGSTYYVVEYLAESDVYLRTEETIEDPSGSAMSGMFTVTGEQVRTVTIDGRVIYYCVVENDFLRVFPFDVNVSVEANAAIQKPIEYHVTVTSNDSYDTTDNFGNPKTVTLGELLYSKHFTAGTTSNALNAEISAQDISLSNGQSYTVKCTVSMDSGITVDAFSEIHISWASEPYGLNAEIGLDRTNYSVYIRPYCEVISTPYYSVTYSNGRYITDTANKYEYVYGAIVPGLTTTTGDQVYQQGTASNGESLQYYTVRTEATAIKNVWLSVYRREYDGTFTEVVSNLDAENNSFVTDPHPSLDYARYRITAKDKSTGIVNYSDINNYYIGEKGIIIQWNEPHTTYEVSEDEMELSNKSETFLRLPYNIDVTTSRDPDVSLIKYIGRKHPVSYYGTQVGEKASWNTAVPKSDTETLYTLQRLQAWSGDVYVREPYGTGYWANVKVSISRTHLETVVPVTLDVTRVEGGM